MINIPQKIEEYLSKERKIWAPSGNNAFNSGHPCARHLVYYRLNWKDKILPGTRSLLIFREGNLHEKAVIQLLSDAGIDVIETQRPFEIPQLQLRGKIDGQIKLNGTYYPTEIKSMNPFDFEKINSIEDMLNSTKFYIRGYVTQMMIYLLGMNQDTGLFLLKNKTSGEIKQILCPIDYEYAEKEWKKLESVNKHVSEGTYPERITDRSVCQYCDFRHICLPDEESDSLKIEDNPELLELLEQRESLKAAAKSYEAVDKKLKKYWENLQEGNHLVGGKFQVAISTYNRKIYPVPQEIKKEYEEVKPVSKTVITKLSEDKNDPSSEDSISA